MRIIPVIDLMKGQVVRAVAGERERYAPIESVLVKGSDPLLVARAFQGFGLEELYTADLDSIESTGHNLISIRRLAATGMRIMVDGGFREAAEAQSHIDEGVEKIVLATETLGSLKEVSKLIDLCHVPVVASVDLKAGQVIARSRSLRQPVETLVQKFEAEGASEIILLSLDRVGTSVGPDYRLLEKVSGLVDVPILVGGGIRNVADIRRLSEQGVAGVLIATALHRGAITKRDLIALRD